MKSSFFARLLKTASANAVKVAFVDQEGTRGTTYGEMMELAWRVAAYIRQQDVPDNSFIAVRMPSCMEYMAAEIGIWMSGCAAVPMGMNYPQKRIDYILKHSESPLLLTLETVRELKNTPNPGMYPPPGNPAHRNPNSGARRQCYPDIYFR